MDLEEQYDKLLRYCYMKVRDRSLAEDITQDTFVRFFADTNYRESGKQLAYLYTIARNLCTDHFRKKREESLEDLPPGMEQTLLAQDENVHVIERISIEQAMDALAPEERELLTLRFIDELSVSEIGRILGSSRFAIYRKLQAAMKRFKESMED